MATYRGLTLTLSGVLAILFQESAWTGESSSEVTARELLDHVRFLASDELEGRLAGSPGALVAGDYIGIEFARLGLKPVGDGGSYFQCFSIPRGFHALPGTTALARCGGKEITFDLNDDIYPLPCSGAGAVEGDAVFAGYGISAPDLGYDDYDSLDVKGKIVIVLRGSPNNQTDRNPLRDYRASQRYASFRAKQDVAAGLGATGLIVINDPRNYGSKAKDELGARGGQDPGQLPALHMTCAAGRRLLALTNLSLQRAQEVLDKNLAPISRDLEKLHVRLSVALEREELAVRNVAGLMEAGSPERKDELLVVGAHYDHIGRGEESSLGGSKAVGQIHNGADDNASGTAALFEIAGFLQPLVPQLKRDVLFIGFTAEEMGLLGSKHYVDSPLFPIDKTAAMINLDMVGRLKTSGRVEVYGTGTSPSFQQMLEEANRLTRLKLRPIDGVGGGASDHYSFYKKNLPVLFFITGLHGDYHRPSDDWQTLDAPGFEKVVSLAAALVVSLACAESRPLFTPTQEGGLDTGPYLGVTLEQREGGVLIAEVAKGSPAARAGLRKNDRIVEVNDTEVSSVSNFYGIWSGVQPGERVAFLVSRSGRMGTVRVQLDK
ncbi:MAG: M28 family peptidase [Planctomycetota bacterium]